MGLFLPLRKSRHCKWESWTSICFYIPKCYKKRHIKMSQKIAVISIWIGVLCHRNTNFLPRKIFFLFQCWSLLLVPFVVDASARGRGKLSLLVEKWFLGNPSKSGIQRRCSVVHPESITLVTDGFYTIRYPTFLQRNLSPSFGLALNDLLRPLSLSNICIDYFPIMVNFCKCRFLGNSFHNYKMVIFF